MFDENILSNPLKQLRLMKSTHKFKVIGIQKQIFAMEAETYTH